MFRNQYLLTDKKLGNIPQNFNSISFEGYNILAEKNLNVTIIENKVSKVCLLGFLLDPFNPEKRAENILVDLLDASHTKEDFFVKTESLSGRYILLYQAGEDFILMGDAFHSRQINYYHESENSVITSSYNLFYHLFQEKPILHTEAKKILDSPIAQMNENDWYGNQSLDKRFLKLLPNRYLDLKKFNYSRIPISNYQEDYSSTLVLVKNILLGTYKSIHKKFNLIQPLTSGWDSRILLGASLEYKNKIKYYIFSRPNNFNSSDIKLPGIIAEKLSINFEVWKTDSLNQKFQKKLQEESLNLNILPKSADIQFHYYNNRNKYLNINGAGGGVIRMIYGKTNRVSIKTNELLMITPYKTKFEFINNEIEKWHKESQDFAINNEISILDLFYVENRMANWGSIYPFQQDIAIEEIIPYNNKRLLYSIFRLAPSKRGYPNYEFSKDLLKNLNEQLLDFPINPDKNKIKKFIKSKFKYIVFVNRILNLIK